jgi:hypothetical protein
MLPLFHHCILIVFVDDCLAAVFVSQLISTTELLLRIDLSLHRHAVPHCAPSAQDA